MNSLWQDLRYGVRMLAKSPGFTLVAVLTLSLGIGANAAIFSVVNAVLLRPLAYKDPERLVLVNHYYPKLDLKSSVSAIGYTHYRATNKSFESIAAFTDWPVNLTGVGDPERLQGAAVTATFFPTLGVDVAQGRTFSPGEDQQGRNNVVVVSDGLWRRRFGADPQLIGKTLTLDGASYTVIGIMPSTFQFGREFGQAIDLWSPIAFTQSQLQTTQWRNERFNVIARLKLNVTLQQAQAEMDTIAANVRQQYFGSGGADPRSWGLLLRGLHELKELPVFKVTTMEQMVADSTAQRLFAMLLLGIFAAIALVLAAVGLYGVMSYSVAQRTHEIGVRTALGAQASDVLKLVIGQGIKLALVGVLIGLGGALAMTRLMKTLLFGVSTTDPVTFTVIALLLIVVALLACWVPAQRATKVDPMVALRCE